MALVNVGTMDIAQGAVNFNFVVCNSQYERGNWIFNLETCEWTEFLPSEVMPNLSSFDCSEWNIENLEDLRAHIAEYHNINTADYALGKYDSEYENELQMLGMDFEPVIATVYTTFKFSAFKEGTGNLIAL